MKKIIAAALAVLMLCSCSTLEDTVLQDQYMDDPETNEFLVTQTVPPATEFSYSDLMKDHADLFSDGSLSGFTGGEDDFSAEVPAASGIISNDDPVTEVQPAAPAPAADPEGGLPANCIDVPYLSQRKYPSGCEIVSSAMLLRFYGFETEPADLINGGYISYQLLDRDGYDELFGGDPNKIFIGDPFGTDGYGCYSRTIFNGLKAYLENELFDTAYLTGMSLSDLCTLYIDCGQPVLIWATSGMEPTNKKPPVTWRIDGTDDMFTWIPNEHCMVLVGYDSENYYFNDPLTGQAVPYERTVTEQRYSELGKQAVTIHPW